MTIVDLKGQHRQRRDHQPAADAAVRVSGGVPAAHLMGLAGGHTRRGVCGLARDALRVQLLIGWRTLLVIRFDAASLPQEKEYTRMSERARV